MPFNNNDWNPMTIDEEDASQINYVGEVSLKNVRQVDNKVWRNVAKYNVLNKSEKNKHIVKNTFRNNVSMNMMLVE